MAYVYYDKKELPDILNKNIYYCPKLFNLVLSSIEIVLIDDNNDRIYVGKIVDCVTEDGSLIQGKITNINGSGIDIKISASYIRFIPYEMICSIAIKKICVMED